MKRGEGGQCTRGSRDGEFLCHQVRESVLVIGMFRRLANALISALEGPVMLPKTLNAINYFLASSMIF